MKKHRTLPVLLAALAALAIGSPPGSAAGKETVYSETFEANVSVTNQFPVAAFEGHQMLELSRISGRPTMTATWDAAQTSQAGDEISIAFAVRVDGGVFSLYGKDGDALNGQVGFWGNNQVGVVDPTQNSWQFINAQLNPGAWNSVVVKYVNGSGNWSISINGSGFETFPSYGSGNLSGLRLQTDSGGTVSYTDALTIKNQTTSGQLFSDDFERGGKDSVPAADNPLVGSWTSIDGSPNLLVRNDLPVVGFGPIAQPQIGTNLVVGGAASASDMNPPGPHSGSLYLLVDRNASRKDRFQGTFTKPASAVSHDVVHAEVWIRVESGMVQWGLNGGDTVVSLWPASDGNRITVYDGTSHVDTGLTYTLGAWAKYEIDYTVGTGQIALTVNGASTTASVPALARVNGVFVEGGDTGTIAAADDIVASVLAGDAVPTNTLFKDGFERSTVGQVPGVTDPEVGVYATSGGANALQVLSGETFGGPPSAHGGQNYIVVDRANSGAHPAISALFSTGGFAAKSKAFHVEFYRWQPATAGNYGNIVLGNSVADFGPGFQLLYGISWPDDLGFRGYDGSAYQPTSLKFTADHWDKVELDWDGARLTGRINDGSPAELPLFGTPETTVDRLYFETSGGGTIFYLDDITISIVPPPATKLLSTIPLDGATGVPVDTGIQLKVSDGAQQVQTGSIRLFLNGTRVTPTISQADQDGKLVTTILHTPSTPFPFGSINTVRLIYNDNAQPPNLTTNDVTFVAAAGVTLFADTFENSRQATNNVEFKPYQGAAFMEINRMPGQHPHFYAASAPALASEAGDEINIQFAIRVLTGEVSVYPRAASDSTSASFDTGQLGFFANGDVGVVDPTGSYFQWLSQKLVADTWNLIVVKYVNGSGEWAISVNGGAFESKSGKGSDGGDFGLNVSGFKLKCDAAGISYLDAFTISNKTKGTVLFAANFDNATIGEPPAPSDPQVGSWSAILAPEGLVTRDAVARQVVTDAPPNAPQAGTYGESTANVEGANAHSGSKSVYLYPALSHGAFRSIFTRPVPAGIKLHVEAWFYHVADKVHWGLDTPTDHQYLDVTLQSEIAAANITVFDGTTDADSGLVYAQNTWQKYQIDYVVGTDQLVLTVDGQSATVTVPVQTQITGLWFACGLPGDDFQSRGFVDDILALAPLTATPTQPTLHITRTGQQVSISWEGTGFTLQASDALGAAANWQPVGTTSPASVTIGAGNKFYRLKQ